MRRAGEVRQALLKAAEVMVQEGAHAGRGPTLREIAQRACVGLDAASRTMRDIRRSGQLVPVASRRVPYRNRPVAEYGLPCTRALPGMGADGASRLGAAMQGWARAA